MVNLSESSQRMHIINPTTPFFKIRNVQKKGVVAPGIAEEIIIDSDGLMIRLVHGHQYDPWSGPLRYISELIIWFSGWMARLGTDFFIRFFDSS